MSPELKGSLVALAVFAIALFAAPWIGNGVVHYFRWVNNIMGI